ncbi:MAG: hypothetical protein JWN07_942 [Hyphomicrobiales bacterium]|nr:hypothetical protein [Hyphomicrobiales bacterium]
MSISKRLRRTWMTVHQWLGIGLTVLIVPISLSGAALVWHDDLDRLVAPSRYAVTSGEVSQTPAAYFASAEAASPGLTAAQLRFPEKEGWPVTVSVRGAPAEAGARPRFQTVFLDPPTANVLGVSEFGSSFIGAMHMLHGNLMAPQFSGRQIVGWVGVAMLLLSLTGIWLWWPRNGAFRRAMRWTRSSDQLSNLHQFAGFWIAIPLAIVSATGIYLSFPQQARPLLGMVAPMSTQSGRPNFNAPIVTNPKLDAGAALQLAQQSAPSLAPAAVSRPTRQSGAWRVQMRDADGDVSNIDVVDETSEVRPVANTALAGDRASQWIRWIHEGSHSPVLWAILVFLTGILPPVFAVTGIVMWLRRRAAVRHVANLRAKAAQAQPAE